MVALAAGVRVGWIWTMRGRCEVEVMLDAEAARLEFRLCGRWGSRLCEVAGAAAVAAPDWRWPWVRQDLSSTRLGDALVAE